jgi:hypothetical protein
MPSQHADETRVSVGLLGMMKLIDLGGSRPIVVPQTLMQAGQLIEELRSRIERDEQLLRSLVEALAPIVDEHNNKKRLNRPVRRLNNADTSTD